MPEAGAPPSPNRVCAAFLAACLLDVQARKPGNVSLASPGHGMQAQQFADSAAAAGPPLCRRGAPVGERIEGAMRATWQRVGCNTNLGILLLCAPLAAACEHWPQAGGIGALRRQLTTVLERLDVADAAGAFRAIALANPAGLGSAPAQDVAAPPTLGLRDAMALAASRDRIAAQYATGHADVFDIGLPAFLAGRDAAADAGPAAALEAGMQRAFLAFLAAFPDSHIVRKHGLALAHSVMVEAAPWAARVHQGGVPADDPAFAAWDESLKARRLNPGTSADLCVATALVARLIDRSPRRPSPPDKPSGGQRPGPT